MKHEQLLEITRHMPCKTIPINGQPYLSRFYAGASDRGGQWWYHWFRSADAERHLHSHPWSGVSMILRGSYDEEILMREPRWKKVRHFGAGDTNSIHTSTIHRIAKVDPNTWTLLHINPGRLKTWSFIDDEGSEKVIRASTEDWFLNYKPRVVA